MVMLHVVDEGSCDLLRIHSRRLRDLGYCVVSPVYTTEMNVHGNISAFSFTCIFYKTAGSGASEADVVMMRT